MVKHCWGRVGNGAFPGSFAHLGQSVIHMLFLPLPLQASGGCFRGFRLIVCTVMKAYLAWCKHSIQAMFMNIKQVSAGVWVLFSGTALLSGPVSTMSSFGGLTLRHKLLTDGLEGRGGWERERGYRGSCLTGIWPKGGLPHRLTRYPLCLVTKTWSEPIRFLSQEVVNWEAKRLSYKWTVGMASERLGYRQTEGGLIQCCGMDEQPSQ